MNTANKSDNEFSSVEKKLIKELVSDGREKGFVTIDEINESLGDETPSPEQLEKIFNIFAEMDIEVIDSEKKMDIVSDQTDSATELDNEASELNLMSKTKEVLFRKEVNGVLGWFEDGNEEDHGKYVGDIENGEPNGHGTNTWSDGTKYSGEWKEGEEHGHGTITWSDGAKY